MEGKSNPERAILILGGEEPTEATLSEAARYPEVLVLARAVPEGASQYLVDAGRAETAARQRLRRAAAHLRARGSHASGIVGDADANAARRDAIAIFPHASVLLEAA